MPRIRFRDWSSGLQLSAPNDEVPLNSLRRARNIGPVAKSYLKSAPPYVLRENPTQAGTLHSMTRFNNVMFAGIGTVLQRDNAPWATVSLPAAYNPAGPETHALITLSGERLTFLTLQPTADFAEQLFVVDSGASSGDNLFKINSSGVASRWGIHPPTSTEVAAITATAAAQNNKFISDGAAADLFASAANFTLTSDSGSGSNTVTTVATPAIQANAIQVDCIRNDSVSITTAAFAVASDLTTYGATSSPDEDFITFFIRIRRIKHVKSLEIAFSTDNTGDFSTNFFSREIGFRLVKRRKKKKLIALGDFVRVGKEQEYLKEHQDRLRDLSFSEEQGSQKVFISKNTWVRVTLPKASFEESGSPVWTNVRAVRVTIETNREGGARVFLDDLRLRGGVGLIGDYKYTITYTNSATGTRSNPPITSTGEILGFNCQNVERTAVDIANLPTTGLDPQVTQIEIWRTVGNGAAFFKAGSVNVGTSTFTDDTADYPGLHSGANQDYLDPTLELPIDNDTPNDDDFNFRTAAGPHYGRVFFANNRDNTGGSGNVYFSPIGRAEAVSSFVQVTSGDSDPVIQVRIWNDKLYAFCISGVYEITGTDEPFIPQKIEGAPGLKTLNAVASTPVGLFYLAQDGIYLFNGQSARNITDQNLQPIFKEKLATEDFAASYAPQVFVEGKNQLWVGAGASSELTLVLDFDTQAWRYRDTVTALYYDALNGEVLGGVGGDIYALEPAPFDTGGTAYTWDIKSPAVRAGNGQYGHIRKLWVDIDTQSEAAVAVSVILDGSTTVALGNLSAVSGRRTVEFNLNRAFAERVEWQIVGTSINNPIQLYGVEEDVYVPDETINDSGLAARA